MYASLLKLALATALKSEGKKRRDKDKNDTGSDDVSGKVLQAFGKSLDAVDLESASKETLKNTAAALRAAADSIDEAAESAES